MNLTDQVIALVTAFGSADVDRLMPHLTCTRAQAMRALQNAAAVGYLENTGPKYLGGRRGNMPTTYRPGRVTKEKAEPVQGRFASVFAYGQGVTV